MFLLPCLALGIALAIALGGTVSRVLEVRFRAAVLVPAALGIQVAVFSPLGERFLATTGAHLHLLSYALLIVFALLNIRLQGLWPVFAGTSLNAVAIAANGGAMPLSPPAAAAAGLESGWNVSDQVDRLWFLGDVFALPDALPLANVFSIGDLLIGLGMAGFIIYASLGADQAEATLSPSRLIQPLRVASFRRLAVGKLVSQLGDWLTLAALVGWLYGETASTEHVAGLLLVRLGPPILGGSLAVFLVDRLPKRSLLISVELARGIAVGGALLGILSGELWLVYAALAVSGGLAALSSAAVPALVPSLVPDEQLPAANASLEIGKDGAMALGAAAAGLALAYVGAEVALAVDLGTFVVASILYAGLRIPMAVRHVEEAAERTKGGLRYVLGHRRLLVLILSFATATLATGLTNASLPQFFGGEGGLGSAGYGFAIAALASGLLVGETMVGFAKVGPTAGRWIGAALLVMAGLFGLLCLTEHAPTALLLLGFIGFVDGTTDVLFDTVAQRETDPRYLGSVFGFASAFMAATMTGAFVAAPLANELFDTKLVLLGAGVLLAVAGLIALVAMRVPIRRESPAAKPASSRVHREGSDLSLVVCGAVLEEAQRAAYALAPAVSVEIVAVLDPQELELLLASVHKTSKVAVLHDGNGSGPLAAELAAALGELAWHDLDAPVTRVSAEDDVVACLRAVAAY